MALERTSKTIPPFYELSLIFSSRIEALEAKINQLLEAPHSKADAQSPLQQQGDSTSPSALTDSQGRVSSQSTGASNPPYRAEGTAAVPRNVSGPGLDVVDAGLLSIADADDILKIYKEFMTPHFPFVVVQPHVTAEALRKEKPFLFLAILGAASYQDMPLQRSLGEEIKHVIATKVLYEGEVSMDLVQGLLVHLAWYETTLVSRCHQTRDTDCPPRCHYHSRPRRYAQLLQLAISIVTELRIDRPQRQQGRKLEDPGIGLRAVSELVVDKAKWGRDERRVLLGCHYLSSTYD